MKKTAILTDSTCCLPPELVKEYGIRLVPLPIIYREKTYFDGVDITPGEIYRIMRKRQDLPTTSTPSAGSFLEAYREASAEAEGIVCIVLTSLQSKIFEIACLGRELARETIPDTRIEVIDSRAVAGALGFVVLEAARAAARGCDASEVVRIAQETIPRVGLVAMLDTLWYLARTGRIARAAAWAGNLLNVKPVVEHTTSVGETTPAARPRTQRKAVETMLKLIEDRANGRPIRVMVHHADELEEARKLKEEMSSRFSCEELYFSEFTPGMGVHCGPGVLAISTYI
ncbi:MAG: DegV family protein [Dehalococcoidia bacterium]|nr:DegV family protein [Dehalococcoidia bacterium]